MSQTDWVVLGAYLVLIVAYGVWRGGRSRDMSSYLLAGREMRWGTVALSVMATQASAITFLSTPGQAYADGMRFVQFYLGLPLAMIVIAAIAVPVYHRLGVFTAYEYLEGRFDLKTRVADLGAVPAAARAGGRADDLRPVADPVDDPRLGHRHHDRDHRRRGGDLHDLGRHPRCQPHPRAAGGDHPRRDDGGVRRAGALAAGRRRLPRRHAGRRQGRQAQRHRSVVQPQRPLHPVVGADRRLLPAALVLRHRPVAGAALPHRQLGGAQPARSAVQRSRQGADAVRDPAARRGGVRVLPVRRAAGVLQPAGARECPRLVRGRGDRRPRGELRRGGGRARGARPRAGPRARRRRRRAPRRRRSSATERRTRAPRRCGPTPSRRSGRSTRRRARATPTTSSSRSWWPTCRRAWSA